MRRAPSRCHQGDQSRPQSRKGPPGEEAKQSLIWCSSATTKSPALSTATALGHSKPKPTVSARSGTGGGSAQLEPAVACVRDDEVVTADEMKEQDGHERRKRLSIENHGTVVATCNKNRAPEYKSQQIIVT